MKGIGLKNALRGFAGAVRRERNLRIELAAAFYAIALSWLCETEPWAKCAVVLCCAAVIALEMVNSALETLCDRETKEHDKLIGRAKDMAAGAVLWAALGSLAVAALVFCRAGVWDKLLRPASLWVLLPALPLSLLFIFGCTKQETDDRKK